MNRLILLAMTAAMAASSGAKAGNIVLTGHDDDYHQSSDALAQISGTLRFVQNGSALPVLTFDAGSELTSALTRLGISYVNVDPSAAANVTDALFNSGAYSAFAVASEQSCGGCDNSDAALANIAAHATAIASFFNAGGGIFGLAGAGDPNAYAYVPESASNPGGTPSSVNHFQTAAGALLGIPAVNGDATHNFFGEPGTAGLASAFVVTETQDLNGTPLTVALGNGTISGGTITGGGGSGGTAVPEPMSAALLATSALGLAMIRRQG